MERMEQRSKRKSSAMVGGKAKNRRTVTTADQRVLERCWTRPFPVNGQGVLVFNTDRKGLPFYVAVEDLVGATWLALHVGNGFASFLKHGEGYTHPVELTKVTGLKYGPEDGKQTYWYSYDRDNLVLKYGKGYRMEETTLMEYDFLAGLESEAETEAVRKEMYPWFNAEGKKFVKQYEEESNIAVYAQQGMQQTEPLVEFDRHPLVCNLPPKVMDSSKVTLFDLDRGEFIFSASLPPTCRELYSNIQGCVLDYSENVEGEIVLLSDAIRHSLENGILRDKLIEKQGELSDDPNGTYLRVTLGSSLGKSPGIPYVLEIWPAAHFSPVHNHGNANAVIKVLYGSLSIDVHNKQTGRSHDPQPLMSMDAVKDDVVWIDRNWYQTHKLYNNGNDYCATIQCYTYAASDTTQWPYFDFLDDDEVIDEFFPASDFGFIEMRTLVMAEYTDYVKRIAMIKRK